MVVTLSFGLMLTSRSLRGSVDLNTDGAQEGVEATGSLPSRERGFKSFFRLQPSDLIRRSLRGSVDLNYSYTSKTVTLLSRSLRGSVDLNWT